MYIYYDTKGTLKELVNDTAIRQFDSNVNDLYIYWEGDHAVSSIWLTYVLKDEEGQETKQVDKLTMEFITNGEIPYDAKRNLKYFTYGQTYEFYHAKIPNAILENKGLVTCMIQMYQDDTMKTLGLLVFNVDGGLEITTDINTSEWEYLKALIADIMTSGVDSVAGLTGNVSAEDLSNALLLTGLFAKPSDYVPIKAYTTEYIQAYVKDTDGSQKMINLDTSILKSALVLRDSNGNILVNAPTADGHPVNFKYAKEHYVPLTNESNKLYGTDATGSQKAFNLTVQADGGSVPLRGVGGTIQVGTPVNDSDSATKKYVDNLVATINSINILNKNDEAIEATELNVQSVASQYIVNNYDRQPKSKDGLIITLTDNNNDKVLYVYSENSNSWLDVSKEGELVDLSNYYTKDETYSKDETDMVIEADVLLKAGYEYLLGFTGTKTNGNIVFELDSTLANFDIKNSTAYAISLTYTGDISDTDKITLKDKNGNVINLNCIKKPDITTSSTVADFAQVHRISDNNIHHWEFRARYSEQTENQTLYRNMYTDSITNAEETKYVTLTGDSGSGTLTTAQLATLQANKENKIVYQNEIYILAGNNHTSGYLVYSCLDAENDTNVAKTITITISVKSWVYKEQDISSPYTAGSGIKIENNVISLDLENADNTSF